MTDFREYSAAFHAQNDDILHFGVKGMKWKHHKRKPFQNVLDQRRRQMDVEKYRTIGETTLEDPKKQETKTEPEKKSNEFWSQAANVHRTVARTPWGAAKNIAKLISGNTSNNPGKEQRKEAVEAKKESDRKKRHKKILTKKK